MGAGIGAGAGAGGRTDAGAGAGVGAGVGAGLVVGAGAGAGETAASAFFEPWNKSGISADTETFCFARPAAFWLAKNSGASTFSGSSTSTPSWTETGAGLEWIIARRFFQRTITRPLLSPGSMSAVGRTTCAFIKSAWISSILMASGHFSASADNGARKEFPTGTVGAAIGIFGAVLNPPVAGMAGAGGGAEKTGLTGAGGTGAADPARGDENGIGAGLGAAVVVLGTTVGGGVIRAAGAAGAAGAGAGVGALDGGVVGAGLTGA